MFSVGSGSVFAYGIVDSGHHYELEDEEAYELARRSIYHATFRDAYSGGIIRGKDLNYKLIHKIEISYLLECENYQKYYYSFSEKFDGCNQFIRWQSIREMQKMV